MCALLINLTAIDQVRLASPDTIVRLDRANVGEAATLPGSHPGTVVIASRRADEN